MGGGQWPHRPITEAEWIRACRKVPQHTAGGADGWQAPDLLALPDASLCVALQVIEYLTSAGHAPQSWTFLLGSLIPKEDYGGQPKDLRMITLLSHW